MTAHLSLLLLGLAGASEPLASWPLTDSNGGLTTTGDTEQWEYGAVCTGPLGGYTGPNAWSTGLDRPYLNDSTDYLQLPSVDLSGSTRPVLSFFHWFEIDSDGDAAWVETWDGAGWSRVEPVYGYSATTGYEGSSNGWHEAYVDLTGLTDAAAVRFVFSTDARIALSGWFIDDLAIVDGDPVPPQITPTTLPTDTEDLTGPYVVEMNIEDDLGAVSATLMWGETDEDLGALDMVEVSPGLFRGEIPAVAPDTDLSWMVQATDGENTSTWPESGLEEFRVYLAAPSGVEGPEGRVVGTSAPLTWDAPDSTHDVIGYRIYRDGELVAESVDTSEDAPLRGPVDTFEVSALYDVGEGDRSAPLLLRTSVPEVTLVEPEKAWQGDQVRVTVLGDTLLLTAADADLDLGEGVEVSDVNVVDANCAVFTLQIAEDAVEGPHDGVLWSGDMEVPLPDPFTVLAYADRPALLSITPEQAEQGEQLTVEIDANFSLFSTPLVDLGDGIIVESVQADGEKIIVNASVSWTAPVGLRDVTVDDGSRVMDGLQFRVRNATTDPGGRCSVTPGPRGLLPLLLAGALLSARRRRGGPQPR